MSLSLYEVVEEWRAIEDLHESIIDPETGEYLENPEVISELENRIKAMLEKKSEGIVKFFKNEEALIKMLKDEEKSLAKRRISKEKRLENFSKYILMNMVKLGANKFETIYGNIALKESSRVSVNENVTPHDSRFYSEEIIRKFDKNAIKALLKTKEIIPGVSVEKYKYVNIK